MIGAVEAWIDADVAPLARIGTLYSDRGQVRFQYERAWLEAAHAFDIDPDLSLSEQAFFPNAATGNFGIFLDSSPDRWGQTLIRRREALLARDENRRAGTLYAWDFLLGVQDTTRQGALRFRDPGTGTYLANDPLPAPPTASLAQLEQVARELTSRRIDDLDALRRWLAVLVAPGASLGGARPKANFRDTDGTLWIAKFPARDDDHDIGAWEYLAHRLAGDAGIAVPPTRLVRLSEFHTFCVQRFDRVGAARRFYASAMTMLKREQSEGTSYLDIAQFLQSHGDPGTLDADLDQLFRRAVFNVMIGNRDDHLRNHGFVLAEHGWRLAPAFDINPNTDRDTHVLNLDDRDPTPSVASVIETHDFYRLERAQSTAIVAEVAHVVDGWESAARALGISRADIALIEPAFSAHARYREGADHVPPPVPRRGQRRAR